MVVSLDDPRWREFDGGYRRPYDASISLRQLETASGSLDAIWNELWNNLHHQGDVGVASYAAVVHLARIVRENRILDWNPFAFAACVELARTGPDNPELPAWLKADYTNALNDLVQFALGNWERPWSRELLTAVSSLIAVVKGNRELAQLIFETSGEEKAALDLFFGGD